MNWAALQADLVSDETIDLEDDAEAKHRISGQVYTALSLTIQGDALDKLRQVPEGNGLEAWRKIVA